MPYIIILTGHPCCGKTTLANMIRDRVLFQQPSPQHQHEQEQDHQQQQQHDDDINIVHNPIFQQYIDNVIIVNERMACPSYTVEQMASSCYSTSANEKSMRNAIKTTFDRVVASTVHHEQQQQQQKQQSTVQSSSSSNHHMSTKQKQTLIILDSTNYIKGYRYELYCICKAAKCHYCVVWCINDISIVKQWNTQRQIQQQQQQQSNDKNVDTNYYYSNEILDALILRYEPPDVRNRWDQPLHQIDLRPQNIVTTTVTNIQQEQSDVVISSSDSNTNGMSKQTTENIGQLLLHHSVYNMHNLSDAISSTTNNNNNNNQITHNNNIPIHHNTTTTTNTATVVKKKSAFQKKISSRPDISSSTTNPTTTSSSSIVSSNSMKITSLTAEALETLNMDTKNSNNNVITGNSSNNHDTYTSQQQQQQESSNTVSKYHMKSNQNKKQLQQQCHNKHSLSVQEQIDTVLLQLIHDHVPLIESISTKHHTSVSSDILHYVDTITQQFCTCIISTIQQQQQRRQSSFIISNDDMTTTTNATTDDSSDNKVMILFQNHTYIIHCTKHEQDIYFNELHPKELYRIRTEYIQWIHKNPFQELYHVEPSMMKSNNNNNNHYSTTLSNTIITSFISYLETQIQQRSAMKL